MAKFEITNRQWNIVAESSSGKLEVTNDDGLMPKTNVTYADAVEFCEILTGKLQPRDPKIKEIRLPNEVEWEYACRAESVVPNGSEKEKDKTYNHRAVNAIIPSDGDPPWVENILRDVIKPWPESSLLPNTYGLVGMNGNVWELVKTDATGSFCYVVGHIVRRRLRPSVFTGEVYLLRPNAMVRQVFVLS